MSRNRLETIKMNIHLADNSVLETEPKDKIIKYSKSGCYWRIYNPSLEKFLKFKQMSRWFHINVSLFMILSFSDTDA